jgi:DNA-binding transcriptional MerR regulator
VTSDDPGLSIGEVARRTGMSVHALRYYEREGLTLTPQVARGPGRHRRYEAEEVVWLQMCLKLRAAGMPLAEIRRYVKLVREGPGNEVERLALLQEQQRRVDAQLTELTEARRVISRKVALYEQRLAEGTADTLYVPTA